MRTFRITVNGLAYDVTVEEANGVSAPAAAPAPVAAPAPAPAPVAAAPAPAPAPAPAAAGDETVLCPMPGTILDIKVQVGQAVKTGETLLILEAMKMENEIAAPNNGTVKSIAVSKGASVNAGDVLVVVG